MGSPTHPGAPDRAAKNRQTDAVVCDRLVVSYGAFEAVKGVSFSASHGEVVALLGPNGAGKTSTIEVLEGYRRRSGGTVEVLGLDPARDHRDLVGKIGVMLQNGGVYPTLSPAKLFELFSGYYPDPIDTNHLVDVFALGDAVKTPWRHLSGGEQQRTSLALALIGKPEIVFLDEPTAGVDPEGRVAIRSVVAGLAADGVCVVLATHELGEAERIADRVVIVSDGRVVAEGPPADLVSDAGGARADVTFATSDGFDVGSLSESIGTTVVKIGPDRYRVDGAASAETIARLTAWMARHGIVLNDLATARTLEEAYLEILRGERG
jgi:ABC-2 type transport system ATP-binding protein